MLRSLASGAEEVPPPRVLHVMPLSWPQELTPRGLNAEANYPDFALLKLQMQVEADGLISATLFGGQSDKPMAEARDDCDSCTLVALSKKLLAIADKAYMRFAKEQKGDAKKARITQVDWPERLGRKLLDTVKGPSQVVFKMKDDQGCKDLRGGDTACWEVNARQVLPRNEALLATSIELSAIQVLLYLPSSRAPLLIRRSCASLCTLGEISVLVEQAWLEALKSFPPPPRVVSPAWMGSTWVLAGLGLVATATLFGLELTSPNQAAFLKADPQRCGFVDDASARLQGQGCRVALFGPAIASAAVTAGAATAAILLTVRFHRERRTRARYEQSGGSP